MDNQTIKDVVTSKHIPDYARANNVKYIVDDIPLHRWCVNNGYSYAAAIQMLSRGLSIKQMKKRIVKKYIHIDKQASYVYGTAVRLSKIYPDASIERKSSIRRKFFSLYGQDIDEEILSNYFEMIVTGKVVEKNRRTKGTEVWLKIKDDHRYECSNLGNFRRVLKSGAMKILTPYLKSRTNKSGIVNRFYLEIKIGGRVASAARVIAETHVPRPNESYNVVHLKDTSNPSDITADNLEWVTKVMHGVLTGGSSRTSKPVELVDELGNVEETFDSTRQAAKELGISYTAVSDICRGRTKKPKFNLRWGDLHPDYIETWGFGGGKKRMELES